MIAIQPGNFVYLCNERMYFMGEKVYFLAGAGVNPSGTGGADIIRVRAPRTSGIDERGGELFEAMFFASVNLISLGVCVVTMGPVLVAHKAISYMPGYKASCNKFWDLVDYVFDGDGRVMAHIAPGAVEQHKKTCEQYFQHRLAEKLPELLEVKEGDEEIIFRDLDGKIVATISNPCEDEYVQFDEEDVSEIPTQLQGQPDDSDRPIEVPLISDMWKEYFMTENPS